MASLTDGEGGIMGRLMGAIILLLALDAPGWAQQGDLGPYEQRQDEGQRRYHVQITGIESVGTYNNHRMDLGTYEINLKFEFLDEQQSPSKQRNAFRHLDWARDRNLKGKHNVKPDRAETYVPTAGSYSRDSYYWVTIGGELIQFYLPNQGQRAEDRNIHFRLLPKTSDDQAVINLWAMELGEVKEGRVRFLPDKRGAWGEVIIAFEVERCDAECS
jgi:hypothetical protein